MTGAARGTKTRRTDRHAKKKTQTGKLRDTAKQSKRKGQRIMIMTEKEFIEFLAQTFQLLSKGL